MIRKAFRMAVHSGQEEEYARRHNPIWPELRAALKSHGVYNYLYCAKLLTSCKQRTCG
jgi:L-rhamnose mutarotase